MMHSGMIILYMFVGLCYELYTFFHMEEEEFGKIYEKLGSTTAVVTCALVFTLFWPITLFTRRTK